MMNRIHSVLSLSFVALCLTFATHAQSPIIATVAGTGENGYSGDGGPAISCALDAPSSAIASPSGDVYLSDRNNNVIRKINSATGVGTTFSGGSGSYNQPSGLVMNSAGNLLVADKFGNRVVIVSSIGISTVFAGQGSAGFGGDGGPAILARLNKPCALATDAAGNLFIADQSNHRIRKVTAATGLISTIAGNGIQGFSGDGGNAVSAALNLPTGVAVDAAGNIYIADNQNHRVRMVNAAGIITTVAGNGSSGYSGDGGPATNARMYNPHDVAVNAAGDLYITDMNNHRIRKVNSAGTIATVAGTGISGFSGDGGDPVYARLSFPAGISVGATGIIYIADQVNNRIRTLTGVTNIDELDVNSGIGIYPNPTRGWLDLHTPPGRFHSFSITSGIGATLLHQPLQGKATRVDLSTYPAGVYFITLHSDKGAVREKIAKI